MTLEQAVDNIDKDLKTMIEDDTRSFYPNRETADAKYYDGIYAAIKVFERYLSKVKPGKWIETRNGTSKCSVCNEIFLAGYNYCPWCGSRMEKE